MSGRRFYFVGALLVVLAAWQAICSAELVSPIILASPAEIVEAAFQSPGEFLSALRTTLLEIAITVAISAFCGIAVGVICGLLTRTGEVFAPLLSGFYAIPHIIWFPLLLIWFGIGSGSKVAYGVMLSVFPIALTTMQAVRGVDRRYAQLGRSLGASSFDLVWRILLPLALPGVISGLRIGIGLAVAGVVVTEMIASTGGIGFVISTHRTVFETGHVYFGIILTLCCVAVVHIALTRLERRFGDWRRA
ncbi:MULTISPECIES: ABC transporter permease [unclassified Beijerinckia]|uniref:ABC transporter permease n=1 Tax=unclassified Beijerinckia TaxID=2638183 RepID=UPI00089987D4|nr:MULTISPECIES: ABC transporter permease [unclassified Beijerinckia]MDH7795975.1 NitT/TauT family transport system permease protein [Beijerinckia sp. GAS462]SEC24587.1 NitT/TauT family transport system permease protein/taurine transport system permease protein [Beijerinckia sp. 28-YEA-48]